VSAFENPLFNWKARIGHLGSRSLGGLAILPIQSQGPKLSAGTRIGSPKERSFTNTAEAKLTYQQDLTGANA